MILSALNNEAKCLQSFQSLYVSESQCCRIVYQASSRRRYNRYTTVNVIYLFLFVIYCTTLQHCDSDIHNEWKDSKHLSSWYTPHDLCVMMSTLRNVSIDTISSQCEDQIKTIQTTLLPQRCRVGNKYDYIDISDISIDTDCASLSPIVSLSLTITLTIL